MKKNRFYFILYNFISLIIILFAALNSNLEALTCFSILEVVVFLIILGKNNKFLSIGSIFIILTLLFHCGQPIIKTFGFNDIYYHRSILANAMPHEIIYSLWFILISIYFFCNGYLFLILLKEKRIETNDINNKTKSYNLDYNNGIIKKISLILLIVSILPCVYIDLLKVDALKNVGYLGTYEVYKVGINKIIYLISRFARPAMTMLLISNSNNVRKSKILLILISAYLVIMMISGDRGINMIYLITNIFIYYKIVEKIKLKTLIFYGVAGYFFLGFVSSISMFRYSDFSLESFLNVFNLRSSNGIIYSCLREFGATLTSLVYSIRFIPEYSGYNFGKTYLFGLVNILPKVPKFIVSDLTTSFNYISAFPLEYQYSMGGSYLGELYYNFGFYGAFFAAIIGTIIGKIDCLFDNAVVEKNNIRVAIISCFIPFIILWVRDFYCTIFFVGFWISVLFYLFIGKKWSLKYCQKKE